ncbi:MAG: hypothetical protein QM504_06720 [Pseudomonadota bacterium]
MSDLLKSLRGLKPVGNNGDFASNFFMVVEGFDDNVEILLGRKVLGRKPVGEQIKIKLSSFGDSPQRPTYRDLRDQRHMSFLSIGDVMNVQGATLNNEIYEYRWGNIACRDLNRCVVGHGPCIVYPVLNSNGKQSQKVSILKDNDVSVCNSKADIETAIANCAVNAEKKGLLNSYGILIQIVQSGDSCVSYSFGFYQSNGAPDIDKSINKINDDGCFLDVINYLESDGLFNNSQIVINVIPVMDSFFPKQKLKKTATIAKFYIQEDKSFWRDSVFLMEYVTNRDDVSFWSLQVCQPSSYLCDYMPNALIGDKENISKDPKRK